MKAAEMPGRRHSFFCPDLQESGTLANFAKSAMVALLLF